MKELVEFLARHGYWLLASAVLARQACLPIPANLVLVAAGALAHAGQLGFIAAVALSVVTFLVADLAWFLAGRRFGNRSLHFLCGLSRDPESCAQKATGAFARRGVKSLLFSKFVLGLDAVAAPLAGASGVTTLRFVSFDIAGALLWSVIYAGLGYAFSDQLESVAAQVAQLGSLVALAALGALVIYIAHRIVRWYRFVRQFRLARITPEELSDKINRGEDILIVDLQGRTRRPSKKLASVELATKTLGIPGAVRIDPRRLERYRDIEIPRSREVVLYCECPGEITSARVALALRERGVQHVHPLAGGLREWRARGFPVTSEVRSPIIPVTRS